jgi:hypothetical protein
MLDIPRSLEVTSWKGELFALGVIRAGTKRNT